MKNGSIFAPQFTEISSSGLGRRPLTAETRVRVPVSLLLEPSPCVRAFLYAFFTFLIMNIVKKEQ